MTVRDVLSQGIMLLKGPCATALIDTPELDASLLLAQTMQVCRHDLIIRGNENADRQLHAKYLNLISRRMKGECVAYIIGRREFRNLDFAVNPDVLVPRPETEILHEAALEYIDLQTEKNISILDLCTGSGALAIALKNERPFLDVYASDISTKALETACENARMLLCKNNQDNPVVFIQSDLFEKIQKKFSIIVSNPPYVASGEIAFLSPEVRNEPGIALDGGKDGLDFLRKIITLAPKHLFPEGILLLEADPRQIKILQDLLEKNKFRKIKTFCDLSGRERVISAVI